MGAEISDDDGRLGLEAVTPRNSLVFSTFLITVNFLCFRRNSKKSSDFDLVCALAAALPRVMDLHLLVM